MLVDSRLAWGAEKSMFSEGAFEAGLDESVNDREKISVGIQEYGIYESKSGIYDRTHVGLWTLLESRIVQLI